MKTSTLKKSILDYATKGRLSSKFRESNPNLSATREIEVYNQNIQERRKAVNKELKTLDSKQDKEKIKKLKNELAKLKEIKILEDSAPFEIPKSWAWVKLGEVCEIQSGEICKDENLPILDVKFLRNNNIENIVSFGNKVYKNDRVILMDGENSGEVFTIKENGYLGSTLKKLEIKNISLTHFVDFMLLYFKDLFRLNKKGAAIPHLDRKLFLNLPIPLPPLKEQEKIVEVLDELFELKKSLRVE